MATSPFDIRQFASGGYAQVGNTLEDIRQRAKDILANQESLKYLNSEAPITGAQEALRHISDIERNIQEGTAKQGDQWYNQMLGYARNWVTGANSSSFRGIGQGVDKTVADITSRINERQANIANLRAGYDNLPMDQRQEIDRQIAAQQAEIDRFKPAMAAFGIQLPNAVTQDANGNFLPTADVEQAKAMGAVPGGPPAPVQTQAPAANGQPPVQTQQPEVRPIAASGQQNLADRVLAADGNAMANKEFVNAVFKAFHGRDANAAELAKFTGQPVSGVRDTIIAGSPQNRKDTPFTMSGTSQGNALDIASSSQKPISLDMVSTTTAVANPTDFVSAIMNMKTALDQERDVRVQMALQASDALAGKGAALMQERQNMGLDAKQQQLQSINAQIKLKTELYNKASANLQDQPIPMGLIVGQQASLQRQQAADIGILAAQAQWLQGDIAVGEELAKNTIDMKYADEEQTIANTKLFLELNADNFSRQEKAQAMKIELLLNERNRVLGEKKSNDQSILDLMKQVALAGGDVSKLSLNKSYQENLAIAAPSLKEKPVNVGGSLVDPITGEVIYRGSTGSSATGLDSSTLSKVQTLANSFDGQPIVKDFNALQEKKMVLDQLVNNGVGGPGDLAIVYEFMKALDPTSVVRETEYANAAQSGNIFSGIFSKFNGYFKETGGQLPANVKEAFLNIIGQKYDIKSQQYANIRDEFGRRINKITGASDGIDYLTNYMSGGSSGGENDPLGLGIEMGQNSNDPLGLNFNQDLSTSEKGSPVDKIAHAIGMVESSGNYKAIGPTTRTGDKAYGKYQVMGANIPAWTKEALGKSLTISEFLNDPRAQDAVANYKMSQYFKQYGNAADVASMWFSGRPANIAGNAADVTGTNVPEYIKRVYKYLS